jgi:PAS domain-containing protein
LSYIKYQSSMHIHINDQFQITECSESKSLLKEDIIAPDVPFSIHLLKDKLKFLLLNNISQLELLKDSQLILNQNDLNNTGFKEFEQIEFEIRLKAQKKEYVVTISEKSSKDNNKHKKLQSEEKTTKIKPLISTNKQIERFSDRIDQVNTELDKRNKVNEELISLNKQLLLKDQLLERNKSNVEALLNNNLQAFVLVDTFYSIQAFNNKAKDLFLTISKKNIEKNAFFFEFFSDEELTTIKNDFKKVDHKNNHQLTETRSFFDRTINKKRTFRVNYTAVLDIQKDLTSISIGFIDITDLIDTKKELETSQNLISSVFNSTSTGIIIINKNGDIVDVNRCASNNLNITILKLKDQNIQSIFKEEIVKNEFPFFNVDGDDIVTLWKNTNSSVTKTFSIRTELLQNDSNNKLLVITVIDVTSELLTKERLNNITNNIPGTVFRYLLKEDGSDELLYVSDGAKELWGFDSDHLMENNQIIWDNYYANDLDDHMISIRKSKENMSDWMHEWRYCHPEKGLRWQRVIGKPTLQLDGSTAWDSIIIDITEEKKTQLNLKDKTKYLTILSEVNQELINYKDWETSIKRIFRIIGESMNIDRVYFFKYFIENDIEKMQHIYEWCSPKIFPQIDDPQLQSLPSSRISSITKSMHNNETYHFKISDMPESNEKKLFVESDIKSIYTIPIRVRQKLFGLLGFDDCTKEREWSDQEISFLATIAQNISIAYEGHLAEIKLIKEVKARESILESIKDGFLSVDENWIIKYWNEEAQNITGITIESALGKSFWIVFPEINDLPVK